ncbi:Gfo/Idh/MocA family protein [Mesobacterium pallidum]|uniref:Gfo/Idh/MocA family protein n=1 Tax=Mesobacterium pallidum TaxID=2872037 RepID=UPI001EE34954|nr:Gfo/Idh/MocA family oxidoreductase [Mesobacterium pallidum]
MTDLRVGVIGASPNGSWGSVAHLPALAALPGVRAQAVSTAHAETARATADKYGISSAYGAPQDLVADPEVDLVTVAVRVPAHRDIVLAALAARKPVYCEWPLGRTTSEAAEMLAAARAAGVAHVVGFQARRSPAVRLARDMIAAGDIGTVTAAHLLHSVPWGFSAPGQSYLLDRDSGAHFLSIPGGHSLDTLGFMLGDVVEVTARLTGGPEVAPSGVARPTATRGWIGATMASGAEAGLTLIGTPGTGTGIRLQISGTKGDLVLHSTPGGRGIQMADLRLFRSTGIGALDEIEIPSRYHPLPAGTLTNPALNVAASYLAVRDALADRTAPVPDFGDALRCHRLLDAVQLASDTGTAQSVPDTAKEIA